MRFNFHGWIVVNYPAYDPAVGHYISTMRFDTIEVAQAFLDDNPDANLDWSCE